MEFNLAKECSFWEEPEIIGGNVHQDFSMSS